MKTIREILKEKGTEIWSVTPDTKVFDALILMAEKSIGTIMVIENRNLVGIMSERDYARKVILKGRTSRQSRVKDIMSTQVIYVKEDTKVEDCMALMIARRIRHLPVYENDKLAGIISIGDVVKAVIDEKEYMINELEDYITVRR